jgi:hypothetical protein
MANQRRPSIAIISPSRARATKAAAFLARSGDGSGRPFSLPEYLRTPEAPRSVVLCPAGRSVARDIAFLTRVRERLLWAPPGEVLYSAIGGLLGSLPENPPGLPLPRPMRSSRTASRRRREPAGEPGSTRTALLLMGTVDSARARALMTHPARLWIVEDPRLVRLGALERRLRRHGVRWATLAPVSVAAVLGSRALAAARPRWRRLVPARVPLRIMAP